MINANVTWSALGTVYSVITDYDTVPLWGGNNYTTSNETCIVPLHNRIITLQIQVNPLVNGGLNIRNYRRIGTNA